jgi:hypothetical protein
MCPTLSRQIWGRWQFVPDLACGLLIPSRAGPTATAVRIDTFDTESIIVTGCVLRHNTRERSRSIAESCAVTPLESLYLRALHG